MSEWIPIRLNNFLFNAGVVGFVYMLDMFVKDLYKIDGSELHIKSELLTDEKFNLSKMYFRALQSRFENDTPWKHLIELAGELEYLDLSSKEGQEKYAQIIDDGTKEKFRKFKRLEHDKYKEGYEIIKQQPYNNSFDALTKWKAIKKEKNRDIQRKMLIEVLQYIAKYPEVFCYKDIAFTKINKIWNGDPHTYLYQRFKNKDMIQLYHDKFVSPLRKYLSNSKKGENRCIECGRETGAKKEDLGLVWLRMGVDRDKKKSCFWDFLPDSFLCPVCALVYSYAPLGFVFGAKSNDAIFINNNNSIESLKQDNIGIANAKIGEASDINTVCHLLAMNLLQYQELELKERELDNIQVIIQRKDRYDINIISKHKLKVLKDCRDSFKKLSELFDIKIHKNEYCNVYQEVLHNLLNGINNYYLLNKILRLEKDYTWFLNDVLKIQIYSKGGVEMSMDNKQREKYKPDDEYNRVFAMSHCGREIRSAVSNKPKEADHKLRGIVYQLLNALQVNDRKRFMDVSFRLYTGFGLEIPGLFLQMFKNDDSFFNLGYAFVLGLKGEEKKENQNNELKEVNK